MRVGKILEWFPQHVRLSVYNDIKGELEEITLPKKLVAIIENPLYSVMNERCSIVKRLVNKLNLLDSIDDQSGSGKLDLIIQLPYAIKSQLKQEQADARKAAIEEQLTNSKYGIAYVDATEKITQLNRSIDNNLMVQIEYLTGLLYSQLGLTQDIMDGKADEKTMLTYYTRTIEPILNAITEEIDRKFISKTARTQGQKIQYFRDPFKLVPLSEIANIADRLTRNEILSSNEFRSIIGFRPSDDPGADELRNKNMPKPEEVTQDPQNTEQQELSPNIVALNDYAQKYI